MDKTDILEEKIKDLETQLMNAQRVVVILVNQSGGKVEITEKELVESGQYAFTNWVEEEDRKMYIQTRKVPFDEPKVET